MWIIINEVKYLNLKLQFPMDSLCFVSFDITVNVFPWCLCAKFWTCLSVWGECSHCFHIHCIVKWLNSQQVNQLCPMCRQDWKFKSDMETAGTWLVESWWHRSVITLNATHPSGRWKNYSKWRMVHTRILWHQWI